MSFLWPVPVDSSLVTGGYNFNFKVFSSDLSALANRTLPLTVQVPFSKKVQLSKIQNVPALSRSVMRVDVIENPIPVAFIAEGILVVLAVGIGYMALQSVEKIIENPVVDIAILAGAGVLLFGIPKLRLR